MPTNNVINTLCWPQLDITPVPHQVAEALLLTILSALISPLKLQADENRKVQKRRTTAHYQSSGRVIYSAISAQRFSSTVFMRRRNSNGPSRAMNSNPLCNAS